MIRHSVCYDLLGNHVKVIEKTLPGQSGLERRVVLGIVPFGGLFGTVPELLFEKNRLIPAVQQLLVKSNTTLALYSGR